MYDQHIILDFEMNPVLKKYAEVRKHLHREIIEIGATKVSPDGRVLDTFSCFMFISCFSRKLYDKSSFTINVKSRKKLCLRRQSEHV